MARLVLSCALALSLTGCSLFGGSTDDACGTGDVASGSLTATAGGGSFSAVCVQGQFEQGVLAIGGNLGAEGADLQEQINVTVQGAQSGQTYTFGFSNPGLIAVYSALDPSNPTDASRVYTANAVAGSGSVTVDAVSASGARGSFSFTGVNNDGASVAVTSGRFDVEF